MNKRNLDSFYGELAEKFGEEFILNAGYFNTNVDFTLDHEIPTTPFLFLKEKLKEAKNPCILLSTGSFCPIHLGHIETLVKSKECLENNGYDVIGGYICPSHDEYVSQKKNGSKLNIFDRLDFISDAIKDIDWIEVDPYPSLYLPCDINFTTVIERLEKYLKFHLGVEIPIFFIFGSDNYSFSNAFLLKGNFCMVTRPYYIHNVDFDNFSGRGFLVENDNFSASSKMSIEKPKLKKKLILRVEEGYLEHKEILEIIKPYFEEISIVIVKNQIEKYSKFFENYFDRIISFDKKIKLKYNGDISRLYDFYGNKRIGFKSKIAYEELPKNVIVFDDDLSSGQTIRHINHLLKEKNINVDFNVFLSTLDDETELLDFTDLLMLNDYDGLLIGEKRYPYILPYVCPRRRINISNPIEFSIKIWEYLLKNNLFDRDECIKNLNLLK